MMTESDQFAEGQSYQVILKANVLVRVATMTNSISITKISIKPKLSVRRKNISRPLCKLSIFADGRKWDSVVRSFPIEFDDIAGDAINRLLAKPNCMIAITELAPLIRGFEFVMEYSVSRID